MKIYTPKQYKDEQFRTFMMFVSSSYTISDDLTIEEPLPLLISKTHYIDYKYPKTINNAKNTSKKRNR